MYKKVIANGYILGVGEVALGGNIEENEFNALTELFHSVPKAPDGYQYRLRADNLEWELVELPEPQDEELSADEALDIILGVSE